MSGIWRLKTLPRFFNAVLEGEKTFEVRREDDKTFSVGDILYLREYLDDEDVFTGRGITVEVRYIMRESKFGVTPGFCVMAVRKLGSGLM